MMVHKLRVSTLAFIMVMVVVGSASPPAAARALEDEVAIGRQVVEEVRRFGLTEDPSLLAIGERLRPAMQRQEVPWRYWVIEDLKYYNAFAAPGGFLFITRLYYEKLSTDEAAFVLAHEMAHVDLRHYDRQSKRSLEADLGRLALGVIIGSDAAVGWSAAADLSATAYLTHYSRTLEKEADFAGYRYAEKAGYNAALAVTALSKLGEKDEPPALLQNLYGTHPLLSSREDQLAAMGGKIPADIERPKPDPSHRRDLTGGLAPFDPAVPIAIRILAPEGGRWENEWRKDLTRHFHLRLLPHGFAIAGDDLMYKPDIGDPVEAARSRHATYLLLVTVNEMSNTTGAGKELGGTPVQATLKLTARLVRVADGSTPWEGGFAGSREGLEVLPMDAKIIYPDAILGALVEAATGEIARAAAVTAGAKPLETEPETTGGS